MDGLLLKAIVTDYRLSLFDQVSKRRSSHFILSYENGGVCVRIKDDRIKSLIIIKTKCQTVVNCIFPNRLTCCCLRRGIIAHLLSSKVLIGRLAIRLDGRYWYFIGAVCPII